jgi:hypothetical protein
MAEEKVVVGHGRVRLSLAAWVFASLFFPVIRARGGWEAFGMAGRPVSIRRLSILFDMGTHGCPVNRAMKI